MKLSVEKIEEIIESNDIEVSLTKVLNIFLSSINDWPDEFLTVDDFINHLQGFVNGEVNKGNLEVKLNKINLHTQAWKAESISDILLVYKYYEDSFTLENILIDLKKRLKIN